MSPWAYCWLLFDSLDTCGILRHLSRGVLFLLHRPTRSPIMRMIFSASLRTVLVFAMCIRKDPVMSLTESILILINTLVHMIFIRQHLSYFQHHHRHLLTCLLPHLFERISRIFMTISGLNCSSLCFFLFSSFLFAACDRLSWFQQLLIAVKSSSFLSFPSVQLQTTLD